MNFRWCRTTPFGSIARSSTSSHLKPWPTSVSSSASGLGIILRSFGMSCAASSRIFFSMRSRSSGCERLRRAQNRRRNRCRSRSYAKLHIRNSSSTAGGEQMRRRMTQHLDRVGILSASESKAARPDRSVRANRREYPLRSPSGLAGPFGGPMRATSASLASRGEI